MNVYWSNKASKQLDAKLKYVRGEGSRTLAVNITKEVEAGNRRDRLAGVDRYGGTIAALRSKRKGKYKGATGPPLAPFGSRSRVVACFSARVKGQSGAYRVLAGWLNVVSKRGFPFLPAHDAGAGNLPRRPIFGASPKTWAGIKRLVDAFKANVKKAK